MTSKTLDLEYLQKDIESINNIDFIYNLGNNSGEDRINNLLLSIKTLFQTDFKIYFRQKAYSANIITEKDYAACKDILPLEGENNIFHKFEKNGFISYNKYFQEIKKIAQLGENDGIISYSYITPKQVISSYQMKNVSYLVYLFNLPKYKMTIRILYDLNNKNYRLILNTAFEEAYLDMEKTNYITEINNSLRLILNEI